MTTKHLALLLGVLLAGLGSVFLLPKQIGVQPAGLKLQLPEFLGEWYGKRLEVTDKEKQVLGENSGTEFARMSYISGRGDRVLVSLILSGEDMMTSIHRPERCLQAQGWNPELGVQRQVQVKGFGRMPITQLHNSRLWQQEQQTVKLENLSYYWFVGHTRVAATHEGRIFRDFWDRLTRGYNQRWAMVLVSSEVTEKFQRFGRSEEQTAAMLEQFIAELAPHLLEPSVRSS